MGMAEPSLFHEPAALPNGSACIPRGEVRWQWQHSVEATKDLRYSITFRTPVAHEGRAR